MDFTEFSGISMNSAEFCGIRLIFAEFCGITELCTRISVLIPPGISESGFLG